MAARPLIRDPRTGRFISFATWQEIEGARPVDNVHPLRPSRDMILRSPTDRYPRWRLRVFDMRWPWRASQREAEDDALASGNARIDREDRVLYLDACANLQRDPPSYYDQWKLRVIRQAEAAREA